MDQSRLEEEQDPSDRTALKRVLTLPLLTLYGLGVTLGAGIYVLVGVTAGLAGYHAPVAFLCAAVVVGITALSYAELATRFPVSAGEAAYVDAGFSRKELTLLVGLLVALSGVVSASTVAIGAGAYLSGLLGWPANTLAIMTILAMGALAIWGIAESVTIAAAVTLVEVIGLILVIVWSQAVPSQPGFSMAELLPPIDDAGPWIGIGSATVLAFFAFIGFEDMVNVAEEVNDPTRTYPRAVMLTLSITAVLYVLTTVSVVSVVPLDELSKSSSPLLLVFETAPPIMRDIFAGIAVVATINGILIQIIMASRVIFGLADRGFLPDQLSHVAERTRTPVAATLFVVGIVIILSQTFPVSVLAERTSQIVLFTFLLVNLALIRIKQRAEEPSMDHYQVPLFVPICGAVVSLTLFVFAFF